MVFLEAGANPSWLLAQQQGLDVAALVLARVSGSSACPGSAGLSKRLGEGVRS